MRKFIILCCLLFSLSSHAFVGDISIHIGVGNSFFFDELWEKVPKQSIENGGTYLELKCMYTVSERFSFGFLGGYGQLSSAIVDTGYFQIPITAQSIPMLIFMQGQHDSLYVLTGLGVYAWNSDKGGLDRGFMVGGGYEKAISSWLNFDLSVKMHVIFSDSMLRMLTVTAGITYVL